MPFTPRFRQGRFPLVIAHRGDSADRPENTLASFGNALAIGATVVEFDVQLSADQRVVVIHDPTVDRTTNGTGLVREKTFAELRSLSAGYPERFADRFTDEKVPSLEEVLELVRGRARVLIEIKKDSITRDAAAGVEARTIAAVRKAALSFEDVFLISFSRRALLRCRDLAPEIRRGALFYREATDTVLSALHDTSSTFALPEKGMLSEELRAATEQAGVRLGTWVIDDPDELLALEPFDLEAVASNCPGILLKALAQSG